MPFHYTLVNLLAANERAIAALFLDGTGETVDLAVADHTPFDMKVTGAYLGIYLRQLDLIESETTLGVTEFLHIEKDDLHLYAIPLPDGYYLALVQRSPCLVGKARVTLKQARDEIKREVFS